MFKALKHSAASAKQESEYRFPAVRFLQTGRNNLAEKEEIRCKVATSGGMKTEVFAHPGLEKCPLGMVRKRVFTDSEK